VGDGSNSAAKPAKRLSSVLKILTLPPSATLNAQMIIHSKLHKLKCGAEYVSQRRGILSRVLLEIRGFLLPVHVACTYLYELSVGLQTFHTYP